MFYSAFQIVPSIFLFLHILYHSWSYNNEISKQTHKTLNRIYTHYQESFSPLYTIYISKHKFKKKMQSPFYKNVFQMLVFI